MCRTAEKKLDLSKIVYFCFVANIRIPRRTKGSWKYSFSRNGEKAERGDRKKMKVFDPRVFFLPACFL